MSRVVMQCACGLLALLGGLRTSPAFGQARELQVEASVAFESDAVLPESAIQMAIQFRFPEKYHVQSNKPDDEFVIPTMLEAEPPAGVTVHQIVYPKTVPFAVEGFDKPLAVFEQNFIVGVELRTSADVKPGTHPFKLTLHYQACNDKICLQPTTKEVMAQLKVVAPGTETMSTPSPLLAGLVFPEQPTEVVAPTTRAAPPAPPAVPDEDCDVMAELEGFSIQGTAGGYLTADKFIQFIDEAEAGKAGGNPLNELGPVALVLAVVLGGIALNLTPCVLPLIPINLAIIGAGAQAGSRRRGFALGGTYGLAMAIVYGALGLVVVFGFAKFGQINSTIWFNLAIAVLFVLLALAMFDVIAIDFTKYQSKLDATKVAGRGTFALAFFMGAVSALLAGACVAPILIWVIVYSGNQYAQGATLALALPFLLGLGMALPWPFVGAGMSLLPKPGMWMVRVKQVMGVFILLFAAYYGWLAYDIWRIERIAGQGAQTAQLEGGWTASICQGLAQAKAEDKPVLIDMWATWCKNCLAMDKTTFKDAKVLERLDGYVKVKLQAEDLNASPARELLERFEGVGLPTYAILRPKSSEQQASSAP